MLTAPVNIAGVNMEEGEIRVMKIHIFGLKKMMSTTEGSFNHYKKRHCQHK